MTLALIVAPGDGLQRWHRMLFDAFLRDGVGAMFATRPSPSAPLAVTLLAELESLLLVRRLDGLLDPLPGDAPAPAAGTPDWIFDLTGNAEPQDGAVFPVYCGAAGDDARDAMILSGGPVRLGLAKRNRDQLLLLSEAHIAVERPWSLTLGREAVAARVITLARDLVRRGSTAPVRVLDAMEAGGGSLAAYLLRALTRAQAQLDRLLANEEHWRIGWRRTQGDSVRDRLSWPDAAHWTWLHDDRRRYYADPFVFVKDGVTHVFCEEYPYGTKKGVISWFALDPAGAPMARPRAVLEAPVHLSYPFVFEHDGQIWMAPESSGSKSLALYRADPFPTKWTLDRTLIESTDLSDATLFAEGGRWWMTAATREDAGSSWDCLSLFTAPSPLGPWRRCGVTAPD